MNSYDLSRNFWDWAFENPELISPNHAAIYFFAIEHCNRLGWKEKFGFPSQMTMDAIGISKYQTYIKYFNDLVNYGFIKLIQKSKNQYSSNVISIIVAMPKKGKALDKALIKHGAKQTQKQPESMGQSKHESDGSINKQRTIEQINKEQETILFKKLQTIFFTFFESKYNQKYQFSGQDGKQLKYLIRKLRSAIKNKQKIEPTEYDMENGLNHLLKIAYSDKWLSENFTIPTINSKFNNIISKNGKQEKGDFAAYYDKIFH